MRSIMLMRTIRN